MALLGFLLLIVVAVAVTVALFRGGGSVRIDAEWLTVNTNVSGVFFAGVVTTLLFGLGVWLVIHGAKRTRRRRGEIKDLRRRAESADRAGPQQQTGSPDQAESTRPDSTSSGGPDDHFDTAPREP
jgi:hypothetical protein